MLQNLNKLLLLLLFAGWQCQSFSQAGTYWSDRHLQQAVEAAMIKDGMHDHLSIRPLSLREAGLLEAAVADTSRILGLSPGNFWEVPDERELKISVLPLLNVGVGYSNKRDALYTAGSGVATHIRYGKKLGLYADFQGGVERLPGYIDNFVDSLGVIPSMGRNYGDGDLAAYMIPTARLAYAPSEYFEFELGYGSNFFGNGYRSMMLSDVAFNNPYLKITTDVWHFKYVNIFSALKDIGIDPSDPGTFRNKYTSTHYFSWAATSWLNVGLFETIVWQGQDTMSQRGFDPNYLNPIIFYRPVEYSVGSPDNALIGLDLSAKIAKSVLVYGQVVFDEFLLSAFRARNGWWANKWGGQLGVKAYDPFGITGLNVQAEFNVVRPFTYTHGSVLQNFGHYNQPLAHILGTNFYEGQLFAYYEKNGWYGDAQWMYAEYGRDPDSLNLGGDIYRSYVNPALQYGNKIGQGIAHQLIYQKLTAGRIINEAMNLRLGLTYTYRRLSAEGMDPNTEHIIGLNLSTAIRNNYRDF